MGKRTITIVTHTGGPIPPREDTYEEGTPEYDYWVKRVADAKRSLAEGRAWIAKRKRDARWTMGITAALFLAMGGYLAWAKCTGNMDKPAVQFQCGAKNP